jgi:hypothetical protein
MPRGVHCVFPDNRNHTVSRSGSKNGICQMLLKNEAAASASSEMFATGAITIDWNKTMVITISDRILCLVALISFSICSFKKHQSPGFCKQKQQTVQLKINEIHRR